MNSYRELCDNCAQGGSSFGSSFGGFGSSGFRPRRSLSFHLDQGQDVPPNFRNVGNFFQPSGHIQGVVHANLNGDIVGKLTGKIEGLPGLLGYMGSLGNLGNLGLSLPFSVQVGDRTL